jgi:predicted nucleic acid-binding protein
MLIHANLYKAIEWMNSEAGRQRAMGLELVGSLRVLTEAKALGIIPAVRPIVEELQARRYWRNARSIFLLYGVTFLPIKN